MNYRKEIDRVQTPPPPYEATAFIPDNGAVEATSSAPCYQEIWPPSETHKVASHYAGAGSTTAREQPTPASPEYNSSKSSHCEQGKRERTRKNPMMLLQAAQQSYKNKRRVKEAARKVDFYEKLYGFVPKNAMTEAEWRDARERAQKTKVPSKGRSSGVSSLTGLGGIPGGC